MLKKIFILTLIIINYSCNEDDTPSEAVIKTFGNQILSTGGDQLIGDLVNLGDEPITSFGFEMFSEENNVNYNKVHEVSSTPEPGFFTYDILESLHQGVHYSYNAFLRTETNIIRGDTLSLNAAGNVPTILNCEPSVAHIGDTVTLYLENLGENENKTLVYFGNNLAEILEIGDNEITFIVPRPSFTNREIKVVSYGRHTTNDDILDLYAPVINNTDPPEAFFGETVTLIGDHFNLNLEYTSAKVGGLDAEVISTSRNEVEIVIPEDVNYSNSTISLYAQNQYVEYDFNLLLPEIIDVPDAIYTDEYFDITVTRGDESKTLFYLDNNKLHANLIDDVTYRFYINSGRVFDDRETILRWELNDQIVQYEEPLVVSNPFYNMMEYYGRFPFNEYFATTINGTGFVIGNYIYNSDAAYYIYNYNSQNESWVNQTLISESDGTLHNITESSFVYSEYDNSIYGLGRSYPNENFIKIDPATGYFTFLENNISSNYPGKGFAHLNKIYYINPTNSSIKAYNISSDSWEIISQVPYNMSTGRNYFISTIVVGDYVYFANGDDGTQFNDFWRMNLNTYQWEQLPANPNPKRQGTVYQLGDELHFVTNEVYKFNLITKVWSHMDKHGMPDISDTPIESFLHDGIPYVIKGFQNNGFYTPNLYFGDRVE